MLENLKRQLAADDTIDRARTLEILFELQTLYFSDDEAVIKYGEPSYWENLSGGLLTCCCIDEDDDRKVDHDDDENNTLLTHPLSTNSSTSNLMKNITSRGYDVLPPPTFRNKEVSPMAFSSTIEALGNAGWPPQFLLMYNEIWELLKDSVHAMIGEACENLYIESDVNIWSLQRNDPTGSYIGGNFIQPHRDMVYDACHDDDEQPTSLSVWIPLNPSGATSHNGCMRLLPIEEDDFFYSPQHPRHSNNSEYSDDDAEKLLCSQFGSGIWDPTCVHWGGSYEADKTEEEPRSSLAFTVRLGKKAADFGTCISSTSPKQQTGPSACLVKNCNKGGSKRRLQVVAKSLLSYSHHWPGFPFEGFRENMGLSI